jgi:hypothetical protein
VLDHTRISLLTCERKYSGEIDCLTELASCADQECDVDARVLYRRQSVIDGVHAAVLNCRLTNVLTSVLSKHVCACSLLPSLPIVRRQVKQQHCRFHAMLSFLHCQFADCFVVAKPIAVIVQ